jgi:hypothetical protein
MALLIYNGVSLRVIMMGSTFMFIHGVISSTALLMQFVNVRLALLIPWPGEKWRGGVLARPVLTETTNRNHRLQLRIDRGTHQGRPTGRRYARAA